MNLILCYTPLQVLIAEKIIEQHPNEAFFGVMIYSTQNKKFEYYQQRLAQKCNAFFAMHQKIDRLGLLKQLCKLKCHFTGKQFDKVFLASINDLQMQVILSTIKFNTLFSFDDGTANIVPTSVFYQEEPNTLIRKCINLLFGNRFSTKKIKAISKQHFTIYPHLANIIENTQPIQLGTSKSTLSSNDSVKSILLGQPVYLDKQKNIELAEKVIQQFNIDYYLPHPREQYKLDKVSYLETPFIFEDYISQNSNQHYRIYTYFSSAVLNVLNLENIEVIALRIETDEPAFIACYDLFQNANIKLIDIREKDE